MAEAEPYAITTYRYLRVSMAVMIVGLFVSVFIEWLKTSPRCFQTSISAYYYTPAQAIFVGALITIGASLVILKGNDDQEDIFLNIAGMLAPVVALVPTPYKENCYSVALDSARKTANIENNVAAYLVMGGLALVVSAVLQWNKRGWGNMWTKTYSWGLGVGVFWVLLVLSVFVVDEEFFAKVAHYTAAGAMFGFIVLVVIWNARGVSTNGLAGDTSNKGGLNRYQVIATLMILTAVVILGYKWIVGWDHAFLWVEGLLIVQFAAFWLLQTKELWDKGLRPKTAG